MSRSSKAMVIFASPNTLDHSAKVYSRNYCLDRIHSIAEWQLVICRLGREPFDIYTPNLDSRHPQHRR